MANPKNALVPATIQQANVKVDINVDSITSIGIVRYEKALNKHLAENRKAREEARKEHANLSKQLQDSLKKNINKVFEKTIAALVKVLQPLADESAAIGDHKPFDVEKNCVVQSNGFARRGGVAVVDDDEDDNVDEETNDLVHAVTLTCIGRTFYKHLELTDEQKKLHKAIQEKALFISETEKQEMDLRQRKQNMPSTERELRARLMEAHLNTTEEGRAMLDALNVDIDIDAIKKIGCIE